MFVRLICLMLMLLTVALVGCSKTTTIKTGEGTVKVNENQITVNSDNGTANIAVNPNGEVAIPDGYPKDVIPIIEGGKVTAAMKNQDTNKKTTYWITLVSDKSAKEVQSFYQEAIKDATDTTSAESNGGYFNTGIKGEYSYTITIESTETDGKKQTTVIVVIAPKS